MNAEVIRVGRNGDLEIVREIERSAGLIFAEYEMSAIAEDEPPSIESLSSYCRDGRLWVVANESDHPIAYLIVDLVDGCAYIEQISVHADYAGKGLGSSLIDMLVLWAKDRKLPAITLTTFSEVPWNAPYYERLGFETLTEVDQSPGLRLIRQGEKEHGLDRWPRVCMRMNLPE